MIGEGVCIEDFLSIQIADCFFAHDFLLCVVRLVLGINGSLVYLAVVAGVIHDHSRNWCCALGRHLVHIDGSQDGCFSSR